MTWFLLSTTLLFAGLLFVALYGWGRTMGERDELRLLLASAEDGWRWTIAALENEQKYAGEFQRRLGVIQVDGQDGEA
jgi:hypothetical protein